MYKDEKLQDMQQELIKQMDEESAVEELIEHATEEIARNLAKIPIHTSIINDTPYVFEYISYKRDGQIILCLYVSNANQRKISPTKYAKTKLEVPYNNTLQEIDNLKGLVESFIRYKTGNIKPDEM